jgi:hypothetical protein
MIHAVRVFVVEVEKIKEESPMRDCGSGGRWVFVTAGNCAAI